MPTATVDLDQFTWSEAGLHTQVSTAVTFNTAIEVQPTRGGAEILELLRSSDAWCSRRNTTKLTLGVSTDPALQCDWVRWQHTQRWLIDVFEKSKVWRDLGFRFVACADKGNLQASDAVQATIYATLVNEVFYTPTTSSSQPAIDLTNIQPPSSVITYDVLSLRLRWHFSSSCLHQNSISYSHTKKNYKSALDYTTLSAAINKGLGSALGANYTNRSKHWRSEQQNWLQLGRVAPSLFKNGFAEQIWQRARLTNSISKFLVKFVMCEQSAMRQQKVAAAGLCWDEKYTTEDISHHLWMTMTNAIVARPPDRHLRSVWQDHVSSNAEAIASQTESLAAPIEYEEHETFTLFDTQHGADRWEEHFSPCLMTSHQLRNKIDNSNPRLYPETLTNLPQPNMLRFDDEQICNSISHSTTTSHVLDETGKMQDTFSDDLLYSEQSKNVSICRSYGRPRESNNNQYTAVSATPSYLVQHMAWRMNVDLSAGGIRLSAPQMSVEQFPNCNQSCGSVAHAADMLLPPVTDFCITNETDLPDMLLNESGSSTQIILTDLGSEGTAVHGNMDNLEETLPAHSCSELFSDMILLEDI